MKASTGASTSRGTVAVSSGLRLIAPGTARRSISSRKRSMGARPRPIPYQASSPVTPSRPDSRIARLPSSRHSSAVLAVPGLGHLHDHRLWLAVDAAGKCRDPNRRTPDLPVLMARPALGHGLRRRRTEIRIASDESPRISHGIIHTVLGVALQHGQRSLRQIERDPAVLVRGQPLPDGEDRAVEQAVVGHLHDIVDDNASNRMPAPGRPQAARYPPSGSVVVTAGGCALGSRSFEEVAQSPDGPNLRACSAWSFFRSRAT